MKELASGSSRHAPFELCMLMALPCGCVVFDFRSETLSRICCHQAIEAKGLHCMLRSHASGTVMSLGVTRELDTSQLDDLTATQPAALRPV